MPARSKVLFLTFTNNLVNEVKNDLRGVELDDIELKTRTLHSFQASEFHRLFPRLDYFPDLPILIEDDARFFGHKYTTLDFNEGFATQTDTEARTFYLKRASYYEAAGYDDAGFRVLGHYESNSEPPPSYDLVIVDEYQDFNRLEARFLEVLGTGNAMLVAGDDDQSIYGFRHASPEFLQALHNGSEFTAFELYQSGRSPDVVVQAANAAVKSASGIGLLGGRIKKRFASYYPDKFPDDQNHPKIQRVDCTTVKVRERYIHTAIEETSEGLDPAQIPRPKEPYFLVVGAGLRTHELESLTDLLIERLDPDRFEVEGYQGSSEYGNIFLEEGYKRIRKSPGSNLGWRIILLNDPDDCDTDSILQGSKTGVPLGDLLPEAYVQRHEDAALAVDVSDVVISSEELQEPEPKIRVKVATYLGAKGLSASHVFVIGLTNGILPQDASNIKDDEFRQFYVSLTRTRGSLHLVTNKVYVPKITRSGEKDRGRSSDRPSLFLGFIPESLVERSSYKTSDFK